MTTAAMTEKQRRALEAKEMARQQGCSLTEYAKGQRLVVREIYDALSALRRKGVLAKAAGEPKSKFVSVRVAPVSTICVIHRHPFNDNRPLGSREAVCPGATRSVVD